MKKFEGYSQNLEIKLYSNDMIQLKNTSTGKTFSLTLDEATEAIFLIRETLGALNYSKESSNPPPDQL